LRRFIDDLRGIRWELYIREGVGSDTLRALFVIDQAQPAFGRPKERRVGAFTLA
jgi:hypothetical protein